MTAPPEAAPARHERGPHFLCQIIRAHDKTGERRVARARGERIQIENGRRRLNHNPQGRGVRQMRANRINVGGG